MPSRISMLRCFITRSLIQQPRNPKETLTNTNSYHNSTKLATGYFSLNSEEGNKTNGFGPSSKSNAWTEVGQAAYDFRSDYVTSPSAAMLESIVKTTLLDDVMMEDPTTNSFQAYMAELTGKEDALLVSSGTMGNQIALRSALMVPP